MRRYVLIEYLFAGRRKLNVIDCCNVLDAASQYATSARYRCCAHCVSYMTGSVLMIKYRFPLIRSLAGRDQLLGNGVPGSIGLTMGY